MFKSVNLNAELREWLGKRLSEVLGDNPNNIHVITFDIREVSADIFRYVYDYQIVRQWPSVDANTACILGVERSTVWRKLAKK